MGYNLLETGTLLYIQRLYPTDPNTFDPNFLAHPSTSFAASPLQPPTSILHIKTLSPETLWSQLLSHHPPSPGHLCWHWTMDHLRREMVYSRSGSQHQKMRNNQLPNFSNENIPLLCMKHLPASSKTKGIHTKIHSFEYFRAPSANVNKNKLALHCLYLWIRNNWQKWWKRL